MQVEKGFQFLIIEVGLQDSGELFRLQLKMDVVQTTTDKAVYAIREETKVVIVPKIDARVDSARLLANPADFVTVDKWVGDFKFNGAKIVLALWDTLNEGC